jgi:hypothetical protein
MNSTSEACCNEVANFFALRLPEEFILEVRFWCQNKFPAWQIAILISWILQEGSGRKLHIDEKHQQDIEIAISRSKEKTRMSIILMRRAIRSLFPAEIKLSQWTIFLEKIFSKKPNASVELIAYVFAIFSSGGIKDEAQLDSIIHEFYAATTIAPRAPGSYE